MGYILNREAMRVVNKNERGNVTYRKRYKKGDEVDTSYMEDAHVEGLIAKGILVDSEDDVEETPDAGDLSPASGPYGAASSHQDGTTPAAPPVAPVQEDGTADVPREEGEAESTESGDEDEVEEVDEYSDMDYATLQQTAKERGLNAGGSGDDLRERLREDDAS